LISVALPEFGFEWVFEDFATRPISLWNLCTRCRAATKPGKLLDAYRLRVRAFGRTDSFGSLAEGDSAAIPRIPCDCRAGTLSPSRLGPPSGKAGVVPGKVPNGCKTGGGGGGGGSGGGGGGGVGGGKIRPFAAFSLKTGCFRQVNAAPTAVKP